MWAFTISDRISRWLWPGAPPSDPLGIVPVLIMGMYKCGTSWLLAALSAHPAVAGLREVDVVRGVTGRRDGKSLLPPPAERAGVFFGGSPYTRLGSEAAERLAAEGQSRQSADVRENLVAVEAGRPLAFGDLPSGIAAHVWRALHESGSLREWVREFCRAHAGLVPDGTHLVLKSADQLPLFDLVRALLPEGRQVVILRDGRDAAISAVHFRKLMQAQGAPWVRAGERDFWRHLEAWVDRARRLSRLRQRMGLYILRYEDLTAQFENTLTPLLEWLGLAHDAATVAAIRQASSFEAMTGRSRGEAAEAVIRKGAIREWGEVLTPAEQARAWDIAGETLTRFGYGRDGALLPLTATPAPDSPSPA